MLNLLLVDDSSNNYALAPHTSYTASYIGSCLLSASTRCASTRVGGGAAPLNGGFTAPYPAFVNDSYYRNNSPIVTIREAIEAISAPFFLTNRLTMGIGDVAMTDVGGQFDDNKQSNDAVLEWMLLESYASVEDSCHVIQLHALNRNYQALQDFQVLIVDDEEDSLELLRMILETEGAKVTAVTSADAALQTLALYRPHLLISDIGMPEIDGYTLIRQLRLQEGQAAPLPAIALTAYAGQEEQSKAVAAGFQIYLAKPVSPDDLIQAIVSLIS